MEYPQSNCDYSIPNQRIVEDTYNDARKFNQLQNAAQIQYQKEVAVYEAKKKIDTQSVLARQEHKMWMKEYEAELRLNKYAEIAINADGIINAITHEGDNTTSKVVTNMRSPKLDRLIHLEQPEEFVFALSADLGNQKSFVYLDGTNIGNTNYLLKKFTARGIFFYSDVSAQQKIYARMLICFLLAREPEIVYIPENSGWAYFPDEGFLFTREEEMTWKILMKLVK